MNPQIVQALMALAQRQGPGNGMLRPGAGLTPPKLPPLTPPVPKPQVFDLRQQAQAAPQPQAFNPWSKGNIGTLLQNTGMAMMAQSDQPGSTVLGNLGRSLPVGLQALDAKRSESEMQQAIDSLDLDPKLKAAINLLPLAQQGPALFAVMTAKGGERRLVVDPKTGNMIDEATGEVAYDSPWEEGADIPSKVEEFQFYEGLNPEQQAAYERLHGPRPAAEITNIAGAPENAITKGLGAEAANVITSGAPEARDALRMLENLDMAHDITRDEDFKKVAGPFSNVKDIAQRFANDPKARRLGAMYDVLTGDVVLEKLQMFKGAISDKEREFVQKVTAGDRKLTVEEMEAGIGLLKKIYRQDAVSWANQLLDIAAVSPESPYMQIHVSRANDIIDRFGSSSIEDPLGIR